MSKKDSWQAPSPRSSPAKAARRHRPGSTSEPFTDRLLAVAIGGAAGLMSYLGWVLFLPRHRGPDVWSLTGPGMWWVLIGAALGLIGGLSFARTMLDHAVDDTRTDASIAIVLGIVVIVVVGVALAVWLSL